MFVVEFFLDFFIFRIFSGCFDISGSMIALSVSEISALGGFCDEQDEDEEELGILEVGLFQVELSKFPRSELDVTTYQCQLLLQSDPLCVGLELFALGGCRGYCYKYQESKLVWTLSL